MPVQLLSAAEVMRITGLSRSTFYDLRNRERFPEPLRLSSNRLHVVWASDVIDQWVRDGETARKAPAP